MDTETLCSAVRLFAVTHDLFSRQTERVCVCVRVCVVWGWGVVEWCGVCVCEKSSMALLSWALKVNLAYGQLLRTLLPVPGDPLLAWCHLKIMSFLLHSYNSATSGTGTTKTTASPYTSYR